MMLHFVDPAPFTKAELLRLYGKSHSYLHRGNVKKMLASDTPIELHTNFPEIIQWGQSISDHLSVHAINLNPNRGILCVLRTREENQQVTVSVIATKPA
jgi:hypothetical protein